MITIIDTYTNEVADRIYNADLQFATKDSFCTDKRITRRFCANHKFVVDYFIQGEKDMFCQCLLKDRYIVKNAK